jgi:hypothetical protein
MASIVVEIDAQSLERVSADLAAVGVSPDDRPLRGAASRADWRLCGELWQLVRSHRWSGLRGEAALLSAAGPLRAPLLLVVGLGHRAELSPETWRELGGEIARRALDLQLRRVALGLVSDAADIGPEGTRALFAGSAATVAERGEELHLVIAGEGASARLSELRAAEASELRAGVRLKLPEAPEKAGRPTSAKEGDFPYSHDLRFK